MLCNLIFGIFLEFFTKDCFYLICTLEVDPTAPSWIRSPFLCLEMWELERRSTRGCTNREENSFAAKNASGRILEALFCSLLECVDLPMGCVDTLSQVGKMASLGRVSSVDTTSSRVDTLERTAKQAFWERHLVSTPSGLVSTHYPGLLTGFTGSWCVDLPMGCVDTLSQTGKMASLGRVSSVDTTSSRVDTLERTAKQAFWERHLVSTPSGLVSTHYPGLLTEFTGSWGLEHCVDTSMRLNIKHVVDVCE
ncbi:hypothetical protein Taro_003738 [Colocasia esculenta]|uniref:Uncharacterized protein n=1 Tax=Colocasia esculenta TaxID=4460 RepID=A0A843TG98_COLES|nr:hypothetical protein [Colocasia esculenta]